MSKENTIKYIIEKLETNALEHHRIKGGKTKEFDLLKIVGQKKEQEDCLSGYYDCELLEYKEVSGFIYDYFKDKGWIANIFAVENYVWFEIKNWIVKEEQLV
jgi:hypothetical protein